MKFEEILVVITLLTGIVWLIDLMLFKKKREVKFISGAKEPTIVEYSKAFFPVLLIVLILRSFIAEPFKIPSGSMKPGLIEGDFILVNKFTYGIRIPVLGKKLIEINKPKRGDVIVFRHFDRKDLIKRVVGLAGDHIVYKRKVLYINDKSVDLEGRDIVKEGLHNFAFLQKEKFKNNEHEILTYPSQIANSYKYDDFVVPQNSYFVMGDNRDNSLDSRVWGAVNDKDIIGRAFIIWWSWNIENWSDFLQFWKHKVRTDRIFKEIK